MKRSRSHYAFLSAFLFSLALSGCFSGGGHHGGGGGGGGGGPVTGGAATVVQPAPASGLPISSVVVSGVAGARTVLSFDASVVGDNGAGVNWYVNGMAGGSSSLGTITSNTAKHVLATYTAPSSVPTGGTVTITALQPGANGGANGPASSGFIVVVVATSNALMVAINGTAGNASFVFRIRGFTSNGSGLTFGMIGRFTADGMGGVSAGQFDVNIAQADGSSASYTTVPFTGTYNIDNQTHGTMTLNVTGTAPWAASPPANPPPTTMTINFTLAEDGTFGYMILANPGGNYAGNGDYELQDSTAVPFSTASVQGSYVFSLTGPGGTGTSAVSHGVIGRFDLIVVNPTHGSINAATSTSDDESGLHQAQTLSGSCVIDNVTTGHGTLFVMAGTSSIVVSLYFGSGTRFVALETDPNSASANPSGVLMGTVTRSRATGFTNAFLNGLDDFLLQGITDSSSANGAGHASGAIGVFTGAPGAAAGAGTLTGITDINDGGFIPSGLPLAFNSATFTIATNGRGTMAFPITVNGSPVTYNFVFYAKGPFSGLLLEQPDSLGHNRGRNGMWFANAATSDAIGTFMAGGTANTAASLNEVGLFTVARSTSTTGTFQELIRDTSEEGMTPLLPVSPASSGTFTLTDTTNGRGTVSATSPGSVLGGASAVFYVDYQGEVVLMGIDTTQKEPQVIFLDQ